MSDKLSFYKEFLQEVWSNGRAECLSLYVSDCSHATGLISDVEMTREDMEELVPALRAHLDHIRHDIRHSYESGDILHVLMTVSGTSKVSGNHVEFSGQSLLRFRDGKIVAMHDHYDLIGLFSQLGFLPVDTVALCLSSEKIS
ncbi:nuclear transport factor 2 family protein [Thioclava kandeliae]|uniref:Ester cyclase n=1 Tax=Thioclava kandeliae TaxID=3070818 RepID=A0ABV1SF63_9RHOB